MITLSKKSSSKKNGFQDILGYDGLGAPYIWIDSKEQIIMLDKDIVKRLNIKGYTVKKQDSKRNMVNLVRYFDKSGTRKSLIIKTYEYPQNCAKELFLLTSLKLKNVMVPDVYCCRKDQMIMEFIDGETLFDLFDRHERAQKPVESVMLILDRLCNWLKAFYTASQEICGRPIIRKDVNLRNFIVSNGQIYGIDFENCCEGKPEEDVGKFCAFLITYIPAFTQWKSVLTNEIFLKIIKELNLNKEAVKNEFKKELYAIQQRRKLTYDIIDTVFLR
jgi:predicted Ser/Thr protein kinase